MNATYVLKRYKALTIAVEWTFGTRSNIFWEGTSATGVKKTVFVGRVTMTSPGVGHSGVVDGALRHV